jgi:hypothetical protein
MRLHGHAIPTHISAAAKTAGFRGTDRLGGLYNRATYVAGFPWWEAKVVGIVFETQSAATMTKFYRRCCAYLYGAALVILISFVAIYFSTETLIRLCVPWRVQPKAFPRGFFARVPVEGDQEVEQLALAFNKWPLRLQPLKKRGVLL